ncbi:MAG: hypothetical protein AB7G75_27205 [Candidatus Binatia bacterium]
MPRWVWAIVTLLLCISSTNVFAHMPANAKETLRGLPGVAVVVEPLHPDTEQDGLTHNQLLTEVEQQLKEAGIPVLTQEEWKNTLGAPYLYVNVAALKKSYGLYAYAIEVCLNQLVTLIRDQQTQEFAETWETREVGTVGKERLSTVRQSVAAHVAIFIRDYFSVNPRSVTRRTQQPHGGTYRENTPRYGVEVSHSLRDRLNKAVHPAIAKLL